MTTATVTNTSNHVQVSHQLQAEIQQKMPDKSKTVKMQFHVPPPKQISTSKSFAVSHAKSRIYDRKSSSSLLSNSLTGSSNSFGTNNELLSERNKIPAAILSGYKPPKQVDVLKASAKWEASEPFARQKSRQMLNARQEAQRAANALLSPSKTTSGIGNGSTLWLSSPWPDRLIAEGKPQLAASFVFDQKVQLGQALAAAEARAQSRGNANKDPSVKLLARGSVLERAQKFGKPTVTAATSSCAAVVTTGSELLTPNNSNINDYPPTSSLTGIATSNDQAKVAEVDEVTVEKSSCDEGEEDFIIHSTTFPVDNGTSSLSSIQPKDSTQISMETSKSANQIKVHTKLQVATPQNISTSQKQQLNSNIQVIPRFYIPSEKFRPNTYEIEKCKKNIVDCFRLNLPDKSASLAAPTWRRHFVHLAAACNLSFFLKDPLYRYVKYLLENTNFLKLVSVSQGRNNHPNTSAQNQQNVHSADVPKSQNQKENLPNQTASNKLLVRRCSLLPVVVRKQSFTPVVLSTTKNADNNITNKSSIEDSKYSSQSSSVTKHLVKAASLDSSPASSLRLQHSSSLQSISCDQFLVAWMNVLHSTTDPASQLVHLLTFGQRQYLIFDDFVSLIQCVIDEHPGLSFLRQAPDFHLRYIETVIARIYFQCAKSWNGKLTLREIRKSNLLKALESLTEETDINATAEYFSYEHFYVIYCKFWQLDRDHDLLIGKADLVKHQNEFISKLIIDRIFEGINSTLTQQEALQKHKKLSYQEFVWFLIAEEDKKNHKSIEYWFRLMDLDCDGYLSLYEMEYFYDEQVKGLKNMNVEPLSFADSICQLLDSINPRDQNKVSLFDLKQSKLAGVFFDTFVNLGKYLEHESGDYGSSSRDVIVEGRLVSDFERYCNYEYHNMVNSDGNEIGV